MSKVQQSYGIRQLESRLRTTGKSIIEEWQNSSDNYDGILRNDEFYEERAIDVGNDEIASSPARRSSKFETSTNQTGKMSSSSLVNPLDKNVDFTNREIGETIEGDRSIGTVRSIPIKNYRASLAHDMGTLRRSVQPQRQFESFLSETERNSRDTKNRRGRSTPSTVKNRFFYVSPIARERKVASYDSYRPMESRERKKLRRSVRSNGDAFNDENIEFLPNFHFLDANTDFLVDRRDALVSSREEKRRGRKLENRPNEVDQREPRSEVDLERGNVGKKISVYEGNVRSSVRSENVLLRSKGDSCLGDVTKHHRTIGVPLVGMHNACGLPVIAPWPEHRFVGTLRLSDRLVDTFRRDRTRTLDLCRSRSHSKRKAPLPLEKRKNRGAARTNDEEFPLSEKMEESTGSTTRKRILKRPSFKVDRTNAMPYRQRYSRRNAVGKIGNNEIQTNGANGTIGKRSLTGRSLKRSTLYAKDDGNEAVEVLTGLCLNPLARNKSAANMIW